MTINTLLLTVWVLFLPSVLSEEACSFRRYGDVRLRGGSSHREGRVEVCKDGVWGRVGGEFWGPQDAKVVCRQLGFFRPEISDCTYTNTNTPACFGIGEGTIHLKGVSCEGEESRLIDCGSDSGASESSYDAGVVCFEGRLPLDVSVQVNSLTIISWSAPVDGPEVLIRYDITCDIGNYVQLQTSIENNTHRIFFPYNDSCVCCVYAVFEKFRSKTCTNTTTISPTTMQELDTTSNSGCNVDTVGGVLAFIIIVLVVLLILSSLALSYPRCIRPRTESWGHLSVVQDVLDRALHNPTYDTTDGVQQHFTRTPATQTNTLPHTYETMDSRRQHSPHTSDPPGVISSNPADRAYEVINAVRAEPQHTYDVPVDSCHGDIDPTRYEVSREYMAAQAAGGKSKTVTVVPRADQQIGPDVDEEGYAQLES